jgi:hypothetical protein
MSNNIYNYQYLPNPPRAWSRLQNQYTYINPNTNNPDYYKELYIPVINKTLSSSQALYLDKQFYKGNILQYKNNSANLTKKQKYSNLVKGLGPSRTKNFATQTDIYTNPNTNELLRVNYETYNFPNNIVSKPNNPAGPFAFDLNSPFDCSNSSVKDGGILICGTYANQCSEEIIKQPKLNDGTLCFPSSYSNVPGNNELCWNSKIQTYYNKPRYFINNSGDKFPQGYKGFISGLKPNSPNLNFSQNNSNITLIWSIKTSNCIPITAFRIYINNIFYREIPYIQNLNNYSYLITLPNGNYNIYMTSLSNTIESDKSNIIYITI